MKSLWIVLISFFLLNCHNNHSTTQLNIRQTSYIPTLCCSNIVPDFREPSIAVTSEQPRHIVVGYNDFTPGNSILGWSFSVDDGTTWISRNYTTYPIPQPINLLVPFGGYNGDPTMLSAGNNIVVYVSMASSQGNDRDLIVANISVDGGETFARSYRINDFIGNNSTIDIPNAWYDSTTNIMWVVWSQIQGYTINGFIRGLTVSRNGDLIPLDNGHEISVNNIAVNGAFFRVKSGRYQNSNAIVIVYVTSAGLPPTTCTTNNYPASATINVIVSNSPIGDGFRNVSSIQEDFTWCTTSAPGFIASNPMPDFVIADNNTIVLVTTKPRSIFSQAGIRLTKLTDRIAESSDYEDSSNTEFVFFPRMSIDVQGNIGIIYYSTTENSSRVTERVMGVAANSYGNDLIYSFQIGTSATNSFIPMYGVNNSPGHEFNDYISITPYNNNGNFAAIFVNETNTMSNGNQLNFVKFSVMMN